MKGIACTVHTVHNCITNSAILIQKLIWNKIQSEMNDFLVPGKTFIIHATKTKNCICDRLMYEIILSISIAG